MTTMPDSRYETLTTAFSIVAPKADWKGPIDHGFTDGALEYVERAMGVTLEDIQEAIAFFTATSAEVERADGRVRIRAAGYRAGPAGA